MYGKVWYGGRVGVMCVRPGLCDTIYQSRKRQASILGRKCRDPRGIRTDRSARSRCRSVFLGTRRRRAGRPQVVLAPHARLRES
jgi:hypothetical protein